jgi:hypothetical protein
MQKMIDEHAIKIKELYEKFVSDIELYYAKKSVKAYNKLLDLCTRIALELSIYCAMGGKEFGHDKSIFKLSSMYKLLPPNPTSYADLALLQNVSSSQFDVMRKQLQLRANNVNFTIDDIDDALRDNRITTSEYDYFLDMLIKRNKAIDDKSDQTNMTINVDGLTLDVLQGKNNDTDR